MLGQLFGGIAGGAMKVFGAHAMGKALNQVKDDIKERIKDTEDRAVQTRYEDATQRLDAQSALKAMRDTMRKQNANMAGANAVMGGTTASQAVSGQNASDAMANTISGIAVAGDKRKDQMEQQYNQRLDTLNGQLNQITQAQGQAKQQAWNAGADALTQVGDAVSGQFKGKFGKLI